MAFLDEFARMVVFLQLYWGTITGKYRPFYLFSRVLLEIGMLLCPSGGNAF